MEELREEVAQAIKYHMEINGLTLKEFAEDLGFNTSTVRPWFDKSVTISPRNVSRLEEGLGIEFENKREFILYKGEDFISIGMLHEIAEETGLRLGMLQTLATPKRQIQKQKKGRYIKNGYNIVELERD